jgi:hypothetical protein
MTTTASDPISARKLRANRRNARKSTGPRTSEGKSKACLNALTHGLCSAKEILLPHEKEADFLALRDAILEDLHPTDAIEISIAQRMILARWKLRRMRDAETYRHEVNARAFVRGQEYAYRESAEYDVIKPKAERDRAREAS